MSRLNLSDFLHKRSVTVAFILFAALSIMLAGTFAWVSLVQNITNELEYSPSTLTITKKVADTDLDNETIDDKYKKIPFEFEVIIGEDEVDTQKEYQYTLYDANGEPFEFFEYTFEDVTPAITIRQEGSGVITSGESLYLRHGERAVIQGAMTGTFYRVTEESTSEITLYDTTVLDFNCEDPDDPHNVPIGIVNGWVCYGNSVSGIIEETGSVAAFKNIKIPDDYVVTISSLVVVDRIVDDVIDASRVDYGRQKAYQFQIDHSQCFEVKVTIGNDPMQSYYYEVVYIGDTQRDEIDYNEHEHKSEYYLRNDPHSVWHPDSRLFRTFNAAPSGISSLNSELYGIFASSTPRNPPYKDPIHMPSAYERWERAEGDYSDNTLKISNGNEVIVDLHHQAAVIIYGIPAFTEYKAEQIYHWNNGYKFHSDYMAYGQILPDLNRYPDPNYEEYTNEFLQPNILPENADLWRTRADIFNSFPHHKEIVVEKHWDDNNNSDNTRPSNVEVTVTGTVSGESVFEKTVTLRGNGWSEAILVPKYYIDGITEIVYTAHEKPVPGYESNVVESPTGFKITNTYESDQICYLNVEKTVSGSGASQSKSFDFTIYINDTDEYSFSLSHGDSYSIPVQRGDTYRIIEHDYSSERYYYRVTSGKAQDTITQLQTTVRFTNTKESFVPGDVGSLTVRKFVEGEGADPDKEFRFIVTIGGVVQEPLYLKDGDSKTYSDIPSGTYYSVEEDSYSGYSSGNTGAEGYIDKSDLLATFTNTSIKQKEDGILTVTKKVEGEPADPAKKYDFTVKIGKLNYFISLADGEEFTFPGIAEGTSYTVTETSYAQEGYATTSDGTMGTMIKEGRTAAFVNRPGQPSQAGSGSLTVTKTVTGLFLDTTKKFNFTVNIGGTKHEFFLRHGESKTFTDIAAGTHYSVVEEDYFSQDYVTFSTGATGTMLPDGVAAAFTNEYIGETFPKPDDDAVQISGQKTWVHGENTNHPQSITVYAMNGSDIAAQKEVSAEDGWRYGFNLPRYDSEGKDIVYSINEDTVKKYVKEIKGYYLINTYDPNASPGTGDGKAIWIWFIILLLSSIGLRVAVFYHEKKTQIKGGSAS